MALLVTYVLIALGFSFLCSLLEATLLTVTPSNIASAKEKGRAWGGRMERLKKDIDRPLSAILTLNTIAHTMGAAGAGAQYARLYGNTGEAIFAALLTLAILIFTEIIPKTLGARYALFFAPSVAWFLPFLITLLAPLVWLCQQITKLLTFGRAQHTPKHRDELLALANLGEKAGTLHASESRVFRNLLRMHEMRVSDIMTPSPVVFSLPETMKIADFPVAAQGKAFSRIPIHGSSKDEITGVVMRITVLEKLAAGDSEDSLEALAMQAHITPEAEPVDQLFQRFLDERTQFMVVSDQFGALAGVVTLEDVIETILGFEIVDEGDTHEDLQALARKLWRDRARKMGIELDADDQLAGQPPPDGQPPALDR